MKRSAVFAGALLACTTALTQGAWAVDSKTFITQAIQGNLAEISAGQMAEQKGATDGVKKVGATLVADHTKANQDAMAAAQNLGVTPPTAPNAEQQQMHDRLAGESGAAFDNDWVNSLVADHKKDIAEYQEASANKDAVGQYATATLPALQKHYADLQDLQKNMGNATTQTSGMAAMPGNAMAANLVSGANSFTESEAKKRIADAGYTDVGMLKKDDQGIWRGTASKDGKPMSVGLDYKGNVAAQ